MRRAKQFLRFTCDMKRQFDPAEPELMDRPQPISPELESDLHNLRQLNRYFGSYALVRSFSAALDTAVTTTCAWSIWRPAPAIFRA